MCGIGCPCALCHGQPTDDYREIHNLIARYCFVSDTGTADDLVALFWDDATLWFGKRSRNDGADGIRRGFDRWIQKMRDPVVDLRHLVHAPAIRIEGNRATAETYYDADGHSRKLGSPIFLRGIYRDVLERRSGEWRFRERRIVILHSTREDLPREEISQTGR